MSTKVEQALEVMVETYGEPTISLRDYLRKLLDTLWEEDEGFSGKRPFGNSGWQGDIYQGLVKAGLIDGKLDEDDYLDECDDKAGHELVKAAIAHIFAGQ